MNLIQSPLCSLCKREVENISHLFLKCEFSTLLWADTEMVESERAPPPPANREDSSSGMVF